MRSKECVPNQATDTVDMAHSDLARRTRRCGYRNASFPLAVGLALLPFGVAAEPPDQPGLVCRVSSQRLADGMTLEIAFTNETESDLSLAPGPHLVWYRDATAQDPMDHTARANRLQNAPLVVPAGGTRVALYAIARQAMEELRCNPVEPAGAALYFYQFSQRPRFRCRLQGYDLRAHAAIPECPSRSPSAPGAAVP
jgi:hypothetical protein